MNIVALRYQALFLDIEEIPTHVEPTPEVVTFVTRLRKRGYTVSEELLHALYAVPVATLHRITKDIDEALGVSLNWAPLVKGWSEPTGESRIDHLVTWFANLLSDKVEIKGTRLPCGHLIPEGTFPLERYNGCPFCGTPFHTANFVYLGQGSQLKELRLMRLTDMQQLLTTLLTSPTPLDATQLDSTQRLLQHMVPERMDILPLFPSIDMKETRMVVVKALVDGGHGLWAATLFDTPTDVLRYLWMEHTGQRQIIEPRTLIAHAQRVNRHLVSALGQEEEMQMQKRRELMLRYGRPYCRVVAQWLNHLPMSPQAAAENMNPKRGMWVRMIRALRLGEYSRKPGFERLRLLLDTFYKREYTTLQGQVDEAYLSGQDDKVLSLLEQRPGLFARSLFATMLRLGPSQVVLAFLRVADRLPSRLLLSLTNAADTYFDPDGLGYKRVVRPLTGGLKTLSLNKSLESYSLEERQDMADSIESIYVESMKSRYRHAADTQKGKGLYIAPELYYIPLAVGDRSATLQDTSCALQGTRFQVEGEQVRLFMQWGSGLPAQHLDMDLSARIVLDSGEAEECAFYNLAPTRNKNNKDAEPIGAKHSGDIRSIPDKVGTAEYVELDLPQLEASGANYVVFTCNAYSNGTLSPNLMVGWMTAEHPMEISETNGVAYDPSTVQHIVRISESNLSKGLVFGILKVKAREIVWMEVPFTAQMLAQLNGEVVEGMLRRLEHKVTIGRLLELKAQAQQMHLVGSAADADECYTYEWALNPAEVAKLLFL